MTLDFIVYCLLMLFVWLGLVPLFTRDNVQVASNNAWKALGVMFAFWLLQEVLRLLLAPLPPHLTWSPLYPPFPPHGGHDVSFLIVSVLIAALALWLIGRVRNFNLLHVASFGWAIVAAAIVLFLSHLVERFALPTVMPHVYQFIDSLK